MRLRTLYVRARMGLPYYTHACPFVADISAKRGRAYALPLKRISLSGTEPFGCGGWESARAPD